MLTLSASSDPLGSGRQLAIVDICRVLLRKGGLTHLHSPKALAASISAISALACDRKTVHKAAALKMPETIRNKDEMV